MSQSVKSAAYLAEDPTAPNTANTVVKQDFGTSLTNAVRDNPASAALIGMGVAWLFFGGSKTSLFGSKSRQDDDGRRYRRDDDDRRFEPARQSFGYAERLGGAASSAGGAVQGVAGAVGAGVHQTGSGIADGAATVAGTAARAYDAASSYASEAASSFGSSAYDASRAGSRLVRSQAGHVQQTVGEFFEEQPLALGVLGLALGAGVAALLPTTEIEREYLGETSDEVKAQARALAGEKLGEAKDLASHALDEVQREAQAQGLTGQALKDSAADFKDRVANVASAAKSSVSDEVGKAS